VEVAGSKARPACSARCSEANPSSINAPFGTIKYWMGWTHFLTKTLTRVRTEMSLHVLAYNLKRVMRILGIGEMMRAMRA
jgi:transposase